MTEAIVTKQVDAPAQAVWEHLSDFTGIKAGGPIESVTYEGEGVGMIRNIHMNGGVVVEQLELHDSEARTFRYAILNDDCPLPFRNYSATVTVTDNGDNTATVDWRGEFDAVGDEETAIRTATGIYAGGIKGAKVALAGR